MRPSCCSGTCIVPLFLLAVACSSEPPVVAPATPNGARLNAARVEYSAWSAAEPLTAVNSSAADNTPALSSDGLSLYFGSTRPGGSGSTDLWVAHRPSVDAAWGTPVNLGPVVNTGAIDVGAYPSADGLHLFFTSSRPSSPDEVGRCGATGLPPCDNDVWVSSRACTDVQDPSCAWGAPVNVGAPVNTDLYEGGPSVWRSHLFFNRGGVANPVAGAPDPGPPGDIYVIRTPPGRLGILVGDAEPVTELNSPGVEQRAVVRSDGREIFFTSDRDGSPDIWAASRNGAGGSWEMLQNLGAAINTSAQEVHPTISDDGTTLLFASNRSGNTDIYIARRTVIR